MDRVEQIIQNQLTIANLLVSLSEQLLHKSPHVVIWDKEGNCIDCIPNTSGITWIENQVS